MNTPKPTTAQPEQQGTHFWIVTAQTAPDHRGRSRVETLCGTVNPKPGATRADLFVHIRQTVADHFGTHPDRLFILHFDIQSNQL